MDTSHKKLNPRTTWTSQMGFLFAAIGSAIGLGNIWRFSYMTYENGGGAFLIPYLVALFVAGIPLIILEYGLGHKKHGASSLAFAKISRKSEWLGWWMPTVAFFGIMLYYSVVIAWCLNYVSYSFNLAWGETPQIFFLKDFLQLSSGVFHLGGLVPHIVVSLAIVWLISFIICYKEINHGIEKACLIFMPTLFILTLILIGWGLTLPGALNGIKWYLKPDFTKLLNPSVWIAAFGQIFFTLSLGFGIMITYASYLPKRTSIIKNGYLTSIINCGYSFLTGFAVFAIIGYMATKSGLPISEVIKSGPTLAFVVFPKAISKLPVLQSLFGIFFFGSLFIAGLSSAISLIESFSCSICDKFNFKRTKVVTMLSLLGFSGSLLFASRGGLYILDIVDHFISNYGLILMGMLECLIVGWILKAHILRNHINAVSDRKLTHFWDFAVKILTPIILAIIFGLNLMGEIKNPYGGYEIKALLIFGLFWLVATFIIASILSLPRWPQEKLSYNHFEKEDPLLT